MLEGSTDVRRIHEQTIRKSLQIQSIQSTIPNCGKKTDIERSEP